MKTQTLLLALTSTFTLTLAQENCSGDLFNNYCCVNGEFSGPVISSFSSSIASLTEGISSSNAARQSSLSSELSAASVSRTSVLASVTSGNAGITTITDRAVLGVGKRAVTTEVSSGLTCVGDSVSSISGGAVVSGSSSSGGSSSSSTSGSSAGAVSTSSSKTGGAMPMRTQAPILMAGAAAVFAYGAI